MKSSERTVVHLHLLTDDIHQYFGSIASLCKHYDAKRLGIGYGALRNFGLSETKPYSNAKCVIRKGTIIPIEGNRGRKTEKN